MGRGRWQYSQRRWHDPQRLWQDPSPHWDDGQRRWRPRQLWWPRRVLWPAMAAGAIQVIGCTVSGGRPLGVWGYVLLLAGPAALLVRHWFPVPALAVAAIATAAYYAAGYPDGPAFVAALIALVTAVREGHRWAAGGILGTAYTGYLAAAWLVPGVAVTVPWPRALAVAGWMVVAYGFAEAVRVRAGQLAALARARAEEERAVAEQARAAAEQRRRLASEERLRIARELHDVLGHHLSLINVQAGVGLHLMDERPDQARAALVAIKQASSEALGEVRAVLAALRPQGEAPPRTPTPGLGDVPDLVAAAGLPVALTIEGARRAVPPEVDRAAYRIVQEALTNVRRHAGDGARAELTLVYGPERLGLRLVDDGRVAGGNGANGTGAGDSAAGSSADASAGNGIAGMRERAAAVGGALRAGPRADGGFEVVADLPLRGSA